MIWRSIGVGLAVATGLLSAPSLASAAWTKSFVVEYAEPAMYYGAKTGIIDPGTDCPKGTNADVDWVQVMVDAGYSRAQAQWLRNPANPTRSPVNSQNQMAFRGKDRANVYVHPTTTPESGAFFPVTGTIAEGLNLDGDAKTGFVSPTGEPGVDNNFYKALGCWKYMRGPPRMASGPQSQNDYMREGRFTAVIVVSGAGKDPMNDSHVTVGVYDSPDKLVKDGAGAIARDYTFSIGPNKKYEALFHARTVKGLIISTKAEDEVWMREASYTREVQLLKARVSLRIQPDGKLTGYIGGYRPWEAAYNSWVAARGPVIEELTWARLPDIYYAPRRYADYSPTGPSGLKTHISFALRIDAVPAFVMTPDAKTQVTQAVSYKKDAAEAAALPNLLGRISIVDGIVVARGAKAVSQTEDQINPPQKTAAATPDGSSAGG
jgi:hypothetical protein